MLEITHTDGAVERIVTDSDRRARKILKELGAKNKLEAIIDQINLLLTAVATGDNTEVKVVATKIRKVLNSKVK